MKGQRFSYFAIFVLILATIFLNSCSKWKQDRYVKQLKNNLPLYDSITSALIAKFSNRSEGNRIIIYPVGEGSLADLNLVHDTSIRKFCSRNDIDYAEIECVSTDSSTKGCNITYYLSDNNYQYVFDSKGKNGGDVFENTRVLVVPINKKWLFKYEKPNF